jgi:hypothetical protein
VIDACAVAGLCGLPAERIIEGDEIERALWIRIAGRAGDLRAQLMRAQASHNAAEVSKLFRR